MFGNIGLIRDRNDLRRQHRHHDHLSPATIPRQAATTATMASSGATSSKDGSGATTGAGLPIALPVIVMPSLEKQRSLGESSTLLPFKKRSGDTPNLTE